MKKMFVLFCMLFSCAFSLAAVNINAASQQELEALPGIGPAKAKAIAEYRAQNGAFKSVDDLTKVKGIGPAVLAKLKDQASSVRPHQKAQPNQCCPRIKNRGTCKGRGIGCR
ncbi:competence ComEA helix-hairpin-helix repeat region domain protein, partial [Neisseria meningitidis 98005]